MTNYFYSDGKEKHGPLSLDDLKQEDITNQTLIWFEGLDDWTPAGELDEMKPILELQPPPILTEENKNNFRAQETDQQSDDLVKPLNKTNTREIQYFIIATGFISFLIPLMDGKLKTLDVLPEVIGAFIAILILPTIYGVIFKLSTGVFPKKSFVRIGSTVLALLSLARILSFFNS